MHIVYVDDSKINLVRFEKELVKIGAGHQLKLFSNPDRALEYCDGNQPDIVFLDIEMPGKSGIWLASELAGLAVPFAFLTAHNNYACEAYSLSAIHYMLKPVTSDGIKAVLDKLAEIQSRFRDITFSKEIKAILAEQTDNMRPKRIMLKNLHRTSVLNLCEVMYFSASKSYTFVKTKDEERHTSSKTLRTYSEMVKDYPDFVRIHRRSLVNKNHVKAIVKIKHRIYVVMADETKLEVSPAYRETIYDMLKL